MIVRWLLVCVVAFPISALAQDEEGNEVGLMLGGIITAEQSAAGTGVPLDIRNGLSFQATYARRLRRGDSASIYLEFPFIATPSTDLQSALGRVPRNYSSLFLTPGIRVKFAPAARVSPWLSVGGGYALFEESTTRIDGLENTADRVTHTGALQLGGGIDFDPGLRILLPITFRGEVRDFYSGTPNYAVSVENDMQHNVVVSGGFVIRF